MKHSKVYPLSLSLDYFSFSEIKSIESPLPLLVIITYQNSVIPGNVNKQIMLCATEKIGTCFKQELPNCKKKEYRILFEYFLKWNIIQISVKTYYVSRNIYIYWNISFFHLTLKILHFKVAVVYKIWRFWKLTFNNSLTNVFSCRKFIYNIVKNIK